MSTLVTQLYLLEKYGPRLTTEQHRDAARTIARVRDRLRELGAPMPGFTSGGRRAGVAAAQQCADAIRAGVKEQSDG